MTTMLSPGQAAEIRGRLMRRWGWAGGYWLPILGDSRPDVMWVDGDVMQSSITQDAFRGMLHALAPAEVFLFREREPAVVTTIPELPNVYGFSEADLIPPSLAWIVYWCHEGVITLGGRLLLHPVKAVVPRWDSESWSETA